MSFFLILVLGLYLPPAIATTPVLTGLCAPLTLLPETAAEYRTKPMDQGWKETDTEDNIVYLHTEAERAPFRVFIAGGKLYDAGGNLLNRTKKTAFVMDTRGHLYVATPRLKRLTHRHSSFLAGGPVISAGEIIVKQGEITYVDNGSGHYTPRRVHMLEFQRALDRQGYSLPLEKIWRYYNAKRPFQPIDLEAFSSGDRFLPEIIKLEPEEWPEVILHCVRKGNPALKSRALLFLSGAKAQEMEVEDIVDVLTEVVREPNAEVHADVAYTMAVTARRVRYGQFFPVVDAVMSGPGGPDQRASALVAIRFTPPDKRYLPWLEKVLKKEIAVSPVGLTMCREALVQYANDPQLAAHAKALLAAYPL